MEKLSRCPELRNLGMMNFGNVSSRGIAHFGGLNKLETLAIGIHGLGMEAFRGLKDLKRLRDFGPNYVGDEAFEYASYAENIEKVTIMYCDEVTDRAVRHLERLPRLKALNIWSGKITDAACESISRMKTLEEVLFYRRALTDKGVTMLATLPNLKLVDLQENLRVSEDSLKAFGKDVRVNFQPPPKEYIQSSALESAVTGSAEYTLEEFPISGDGSVDFSIANLNRKTEYFYGGILLKSRGAGVLFPELIQAPFEWRVSVMPRAGRWNLLFGKGTLEFPSHHHGGRLLLVDPVSEERETFGFRYSDIFNEWTEHAVKIDSGSLQVRVGEQVIFDRKGDYRELTLRFGIEFRGSLVVRNQNHD